jgi:hypothetical protein
MLNLFQHLSFALLSVMLNLFQHLSFAFVDVVDMLSCYTPKENAKKQTLK